MGSGQRFYIKDRMMKHMALKLPAAFQERMRSLLKEEYTDFMDSYDRVPRSFHPGQYAENFYRGPAVYRPMGFAADSLVRDRLLYRSG